MERAWDTDRPAAASASDATTITWRFTITSAPGAETVRLAVTRLGDFTASVMTLRPGARAQLEGPFGRFCLQPDPVHSQTWIAGGIGIAPFLSRARSLDGPLAADLYCCTPAAEHAHFLDELFEILRPPALVENLTTGFMARGMLPGRIHSETFDLRRGPRGKALTS